MALCDQCGQRAYVMVSKDSKVLEFCGHHYRTNEYELTSTGWKTETDNRDELVRKPAEVTEVSA